MAGDRAFRVPRLPGAVAWIGLTALLALGLVTTVLDLTHVPYQETSRANAARQRFVVDPGTGVVSLGTEAAPEGDKAPFEVATAEEEKAPQAPPEAAPPTAEKPAEVKAEEPKTDDKKAEEVKAETPKPPEAPAVVATPEAPPPNKEPLPSAGMPSLRMAPTTTDFSAPTPGADSLVAAPAPEVTETVDGLQLPKRGAKNVLPSQLYAQKFVRKEEQIPIAFVVMDAGLDGQSLGLLMAMPKEITVAYSPYVKRDKSYSEHLRALGHEVWTMLPTMNARYPSDDPGPLGLIAKMPEEEILRRVREVLAVVPGSVGVVLAPDETMTSQKHALVPVLTELDKRGLLMLTTHPTRSVGEIATDATLTAILRRADLVLDPEQDEALIHSKLAGLRDAAKEKEQYLVVLSAQPQTLRILSEWLRQNTLAEPYTLAPLSAFYQRTKEDAAADAPDAGEHAAPAEKKPKPKPKKQKVLPQDKYKQGAAGAGGSGGGGH